MGKLIKFEDFDIAIKAAYKLGLQDGEKRQKLTDEVSDEGKCCTHLKN